MARAFVIAAIATALLATPLLAQQGNHGGTYGGMRSGYAGSAGASVTTHGAPPYSAGNWGTSSGSWNGSNWHGGRNGSNWHGGYRYYPYWRYRWGHYPYWGWGYPYGWAYGSLSYPPIWSWSTGYSSYDDNNSNEHSQANSGPYYQSYESYAQQSNQIQQQEMERLSNAVERLDEQLHEQRQSERYAHPPTPTSGATIDAETVLVFRDKHVEQIDNYAVVGNVIWIFNEQRARKIPISQIDIPATTKANDDRGVDFHLPGR